MGREELEGEGGPVELGDAGPVGTEVVDDGREGLGEVLADRAGPGEGLGDVVQAGQAAEGVGALGRGVADQSLRELPGILRYGVGDQGVQGLVGHRVARARPTLLAIEDPADPDLDPVADGEGVPVDALPVDPDPVAAAHVDDLELRPEVPELGMALGDGGIGELEIAGPSPADEERLAGTELDRLSGPGTVFEDQDASGGLAHVRSGDPDPTPPRAHPSRRLRSTGTGSGIGRPIPERGVGVGGPPTRGWSKARLCGADVLVILDEPSLSP